MSRQLTIIEDPAQEPIKVSEARSYARIDYTIDDALIDLMIRAARKQIEDFTGVGLGVQKVQYSFPVSCYNDTTSLPRRPFIETTAIAYQACRLSSVINVLTLTNNWEITGDSFHGEKGNYVVTYRAGFDEIPSDLKLAVLIQVAYDYENRGKHDGAGMCKQAMEKCKPYKMNLWGI